MKRKTIHMLHICLALVLGAAALLPSPTARPCQAEPEKEVLRLHILANSDSQQDQAIKLQVRDALLPLFESSESYESARAFVLQHGAELLSLCQKTLSACQASYGPSSCWGRPPFRTGPTRASSSPPGSTMPFASCWERGPGTTGGASCSRPCAW